MALSLKRFASTLRSKITPLTGNFSWEPPAWIGQAWSKTKAHPRNSLIIAVLFILGLGTFWSYKHGWFHKPNPAAIAVLVRPPEISPVDDDGIHPQPILLEFSGSVAPMDKIDKTITEGVSIEPETKGTWTWTNDRQLRFQPELDWPAGQRYRLSLLPGLVPKFIQLENIHPEFVTPLFTASFRDVLFYINPKDPGTRQVTATLNFSHPVALDKLQKSLQIEGQTDSLLIRKGNEPKFTLTLDQSGRRAFFRSAPIRLPQIVSYLKLDLQEDFAPVQGEPLTESVRTEVVIPDLYNFLKMESSTVKIINNPSDDPEQILLLKSATGVKAEKLASKLSLYLLPKDKPAKENEEKVEDYAWNSPAEITDSILALSKKIPFQINPSEEEFSAFHTIKLNVPPQRRLYIKVEGGLEGLGGFVMKDNYTNVVEIPIYPRAVRIMNDGAVLALSGERKLSIMTRSIEQIECRLGKVRSDQINHLVSQSEGNFENPTFRNYSFGEDNISESYYKTMQTGSDDPSKAKYVALDFRTFSASKNADLGRGLFFLNVSEQRNRSGTPEQLDTPNPDPNPNRSGWTEQQNDSEVSDRRFLLITDLGIIVKNNADGTQDIFVQSIESGKPVSGARVDILGKNGVPVAQATTDGDGFASLPRVKDLKQEKAPVAFVVRKGDDLSFLPFNRADRRLDFSRYDIGGMELTEPNTLSAFLFTERGLYRPGDDVHVGIVVKQFDWKGNLTGLPVEMVLSDPSGTTVRSEHLKLPSGGFFTWQHTPGEAAPTGMYCASIYLINKDGERGDFLGSTTFRVEEFLPDRMKITAKLSQENGEGWIDPKDLKINVTLQNLYGTASVDHKVNGEMALSPAAFVFDKYPDHVFYDPSLQPGKSRQTAQETLTDTQTDDKGNATLDLNLERFDPGAYRLEFLARGFEKEGGRSVAAGGKGLISSRPYVVGYKPDGDLGYLRMGSKHHVELLAIQPNLQPLEVDKLTLKVVEQRYISVLTQQPNGNYAYQSVLKEKEISSDPLKIGVSGSQYELPTVEPGDYIARIYDDQQVCLSVIRFNVVGNANLGRSLEKNAELKVKLSKAEYKPGEEISISITAPYTGAGLITIERDKVHASKWFKSSSTSSVQTITIPKDLEANAYVTITFVRDLNSKEIFMSPLSSAVVPFRLSRDNRTVQIDLSHPDKALPGQSFPITFKTDRPARIIVYAVDEGILQVAKYKLPDPLDQFLQKRALQVQTAQLLDLILPEYSVARAAAAAGGDGDDEGLDANLNPFKRKRELPVVFWSGIVNASSKPQTLEYNVPDYFNGTLRVMAVAVSDDAAGSSENKALIQGPFVIQPNVPTFVAPSDTFDVTVSVANNVAGSGTTAAVNVDLKASENIEVLEQPKGLVTISEGHDISLRYKLKARDQLGNADLNFTASLDKTSAHYASSLSIRPPVAFLTTIKSGYFEKTSLDVPVDRKMYPQYRSETAGLSLLPLSFARGLQVYLDNYPHLCSEQLSSRGFPILLLDDETGTPLKRDEREKAIAKIINVLRTRQNDQGAFGLWQTQSDLHMDFPSIYVMHFLTEALENGYEVPKAVFQSGLGHLQQIAEDNPSDLYEARQQAYAIYLLSRNHQVTTNYLDRLRDYLQTNQAKAWENDLAALYVASSYAMLQNHKDANAIFSRFKLNAKMPGEEYDFEGPLARNAQYLYLLSIHFPERLNTVTGDDLLSIVDPISRGDFSTYSAAYSILGLHSYSALLKKQNALLLSISQKMSKGEWEKLELGTGLCPVVPFSADAFWLQFKNGTLFNNSRPPRLFYQVIQSGFDHEQPKTEIIEGIQVQREYRNRANEVVTIAELGEELTVHVKIRSVKDEFVSNVAILDLLPGGFEVVTDSIRDGGNNSFQTDYVDVREDRVVIYGSAENSVKEFVYKIKATNLGSYQIPPIQAESMYQRNIQARSLPGTMLVEDKP